MISNKILIYGGNGWIGSKMIELMKEKRIDYVIGKSRIENRTDVENEIKCHKPDRIINCAGVTGRPNVDWCEDHKIETIRSNVIGTLNLFDVAFQLGNIHVCNFATGCIYQYDDKDHKLGSGNGFKEEDAFNYFDSFYSVTKEMVEKLAINYPNVLTLRLRMPISDGLKDEHRNFITKIINYEKVVNIPNSMTVLYDLLPIALDMSIKEVKGIVNFVNPGVISHNEILDIYKELIEPEFTYQNFTVEEQSKILKAGRSNNQLDTTKLQGLYPLIPNIKDSIRNVFKRIKENEK